VFDKRHPGKGDILVEISGGGKYQNTGRALYFSEQMLKTADPPLMYTNFTKLLRVKSDVIVPKYFFYYWAMLYDLGRTARYEKQPTNIKNFKLEDFLSHETIIYPNDLTEQNLIVEALDELHGELAATETLRTSLLAVRHAALKEILTGSRLGERKEYVPEKK